MVEDTFTCAALWYLCTRLDGVDARVRMGVFGGAFYQWYLAMGKSELCKAKEGGFLCETGGERGEGGARNVPGEVFEGLERPWPVSAALV